MQSVCVTRDILDPNGMSPHQNCKDVREYVLIRDGGVNETVRKQYLIKLPVDRDFLQEDAHDILLSDGGERISARNRSWWEHPSR